MLFVGPLVFQNKEPSYARMASSEGVRAAHAGSTPYTCVSYLRFIPYCLSRLGLVGVEYAHVCVFSGSVRFPHTEESRTSPISRLGACLEHVRTRVRVRECGVSGCGCGARVVVPSPKKHTPNFFFARRAKFPKRPARPRAAREARWV